MNFERAASIGQRGSWSILNEASGHWPHLLICLGGVQEHQLNGAHQPCPSCQGTDRFRWMSDEGPGGWYCSHCGGKRQQGGGGSGIDLLMRVRNWNFVEAITQIERYYGSLPFKPAPRRRAPLPSGATNSRRHSELERFRLLELADQLANGEGYSPIKAKIRHYSKRWAVFASSNYDLAYSVMLQFETEEGITEIPDDVQLVHR